MSGDVWGGGRKRRARPCSLRAAYLSCIAFDTASNCGPISEAWHRFGSSQLLQQGFNRHLLVDGADNLALCLLSISGQSFVRGSKGNLASSSHCRRWLARCERYTCANPRGRLYVSRHVIR
jgi:hypothetical protein